MSSDRFFQGQPFPTTDQCVTAVGGKTPSGTIFPIAVDAAGKVITASDPSSGSGLSASPIQTAFSTGLAGHLNGLVGFQTDVSDAIEADSTTTVLNLTAHSAQPGDIIRYRSAGANFGAVSAVKSVTANTVTLTHALPATPTLADNITIMNPRPISAHGAAANNADGFGLGVAISIDNQGGANGPYILKSEDTAHVTGDAGVFTLGVSTTSLTSRAANGDYIQQSCDLAGRTLVSQAPPEVMFSAQNAAPITDTTSTSVKAAVASNRNYVTDISITNTSSVASLINILDGAAILDTLLVPPVAIGGQVVRSYLTPLRGSVNTAVNAQCATTATSTIVTIQGFTSLI
jgi:hypothetical protein